MLLPILAFALSAASTRTTATPYTCPAFPGADAIVGLEGTKRFIIVGEKHGTEQAPQLFGTLVCRVSLHRSVNVLLEYRKSSTDALQAYLRSDGSAAARSVFLANDIWDTRWADGRNSRAMFALIEALRALRHAGAHIEIFGTQPDYLTLAPQYYDELARADDWAKIAAAHPKGLNLILVGTAHAALRDNNELGFLPAAAHLRQEDVLAIGPTPEGGAQWSLDVSPAGQPQMGIHPLPGKPAKPGIVVLRDATSGWNARYMFGVAARPSPPEKQ